MHSLGGLSGIKREEQLVVGPHRPWAGQLDQQGRLLNLYA